MPSTSKKQHNFMAAIANSPAFAKKVGVPQSVGQEFSKADKGRKFAKGGETMATKDKMDKSQDKAMIKKAFKQHDMQKHKDGKATALELKHGGVTKKMAFGGPTMSRGMGAGPAMRSMPMRPILRSSGAPAPTPMPASTPGSSKADARALMLQKAAAAPPSGPFKTGGSVGFTRAADGVAQKGKTKAKQIKMMSGGKC